MPVKRLVPALLALTVGCGMVESFDWMPLAFNAVQPDFDVQSRQFIKTGNTVLKVKTTDRDAINHLAEAGMDIWGVEDGVVLGQVHKELLDRINALNLEYELVSPRPGYSLKNRFDKGYHTYASMVPYLRGLVAKNPQIASLHDIGDSWEKTQNKADRDLWMVRIGNNAPGSKPGIVFFGNHHARELVTVEIPLRLISHLIENYGKDPEVTDLVDNREILIVPMVNPDGHIQAEQGANWRKNTDDADLITSMARSGAGVDLNRNYGYRWDTGGSDDDPRGETYHGRAPFSEPETQATRDLMLRHPNLKVMMSYHSFSNLILWPWGHSYDPTPDGAKLEAIGKKLASWNGYKPEQASDLYIASGVTDDWSYGERNMLSFTTEIGSWADGFDPPFSKVNKFWQENLPGAMYLIRLAGESNSAFGPTFTPMGRQLVAKSDAAGTPVVGAELHVGRLGAPGTGRPVQALDGQFDSPEEAVELPMLRNSRGRAWVRAVDANGHWGPAIAVKL